MVCRRDKSLLRNKYWLMKALNMSGNAHMARCVRSTVMRKTPKTVAPIIHGK
ncbi:hypothetical protein TELCIR_25666 [Teladorsagia circumcincta]|uniref:Uncharacterized protein n=1 Tax=Teladorsagia circumcincta TaxID=45464 RepID=A0A2G9T4X0_TELCI|nr:hypothetical protein TELCIR_25666 [Teladorsagia circumcincta]